MKLEFEQYTCVKDGKAIKTIDCQSSQNKIRLMNHESHVLIGGKRITQKENGVFWYLTDKISKEV